MRVDGREIPVTGSLLPPLHRRTSDIMRVAIAAVLLGGVIAGSLITRSQWDALETSVSNIVGVLSPSLSDTVYLLYGIAILALPFAILIGLIVGRGGSCWPDTPPPACAPVSRCPSPEQPGGTEMAPRRAGPTRRHLPVAIPRRSAMDRDARGGAHRLGPVASEEVATSLVDAASALRSHPSDRQLDRSRTIDAGSRRRLPDRRGDRSRRRHPCLEVPLDSAVRVLARRGYRVTAFRVVSPSGIGPLVMSAAIDQAPDDEPFDELVVELYGQNQRSSGAIRQTFRWISFRNRETPPPYGSLRRAVEHRALMGIAFADIGLASSKAVAISVLDRGWEMYARRVLVASPLPSPSRTRRARKNPPN